MLEIGGRQQTIKYLQYIYQNANIFLDRKKELANNILNYIMPIKDLKKCVVENCQHKYFTNGYCKYHNYHLNGGREKRKQMYLKSRTKVFI